MKLKDKGQDTMNKLKTLLPILLILLLLAVPAMAEEAENLTGSLTVKVVDQPGKIKCITDGKYTTFWESSVRKEPWVVISSDKPIYGLYLCFQKIPDSYVIQKENADGWVTVAEGGSPQFHHAFFELNGLKKIRILSTVTTNKAMGFNEIYAFGKGEVPDWVQRWEKPVEKADLLVLVAHPDDEQLFTGGAIPTYAAEKGKKVEVAYLTYSNTTRRSEALNGLWAMGVRNYPVFGPFSDRYSNGKTISAKAKAAYKTAGGKQKVLDWINGLYRQFRPEVVVTHAENGEYGHAQHIMLADAASECFTLAADPEKSPESAKVYGAWQVKKLYLHQYGEEADQTILDWNQPLSAFGGKTGAEIAAEAFALHVTQKGMGTGKGDTFEAFTVEVTGAKKYPYDHFGLRNTTVGPDEAKNDFLEHISGPADEAISAEPPEQEEFTEETELTEEPAEASDEPAKTAPDGQEGETGRHAVTMPPDWADVTLNERGYLDEGEYVLEDEENGHWMYVSPTLRIQVTRSWETPEKQTRSEAKQEFFCYTAEIWCDTANGELPFTTWSEPDKPRDKMKALFIKDIAASNSLVFCTSTDYYTYRIGRSSSGVYEGVVIRDGEVLYDTPAPIKKRYNFPTYETLALYSDGRVESWHSKEKSAEEYLRDGAVEVYTFGPCIVRDGAYTEFITDIANRKLNPRHAFGMVEPGHYIDVICEGRLKSTNGSTGVTMGDLAQIMINRGCSIAVNLDGGQTAVMAFMGKQLNKVQASEPYGRKTKEVLSFGKQAR